MHIEGRMNEVITPQAPLKNSYHGCLSYIGCVCLVSAIYNLSLQLQRLGPFVIVLWLCNVLKH